MLKPNESITSPKLNLLTEKSMDKNREAKKTYEPRKLDTMTENPN